MGFARDIAAWTEAARGRVQAMPGEIVHELARVAIEHTAVDTGALRGNWTVRVNHADADWRPTARDASGHVALAEIGRTLEVATLGDVVHLVNPAPYAAFLEFGTSRMEARPMAAPAIQMFPVIVAAVARRR